MKYTQENPRMILKFDTGADGFMKMIYVLAISAIIVLVIGGYFLLQLHHDLNANI
jgi:cytochrome b subunit of formate dehydrogenase